MELQLWSRLGYSGIFRHIRIPSSFPALSWEEGNLLWSYNFGLGSATLESLGILGFLAHSQLSAGRRTTSFGATTSQLSAQGRRTASFGATTLVSARLLWNPSAYQDSQLSAQSKRTTSFDLQLWSRLGCYGILQDSQLSTQGRRTASFGATTLVSARLLWNPSAYKDSQLSAQSKRTTSFGSTTLVSARLLWNPSGFPALDSR